MKKKTELKALIVISSVAVFVAVFALGCGGTSNPTGSAYKVGVVLSASGPNAPLGQSEQQSLLLLEKQVNANGGINGHPLDIIIEDDASDPAKAATAAAKLINQDQVSALIGSSGTGPTLAIVPVVDNAKVPLISMAAGTKITSPIDPLVFRTPPSDSMAITRVLTYLKNTMKVKKIAILHDSNAFGTGGADELTAKAPKYGITVVDRESYGSADTDMTAQLTKIQGTPAQAIVVWGTNPGPASIAKNMQQLGMNIPYIGSHGIANKKFIELAGTAANGVVFPAGKLLVPASIPAGSGWSKAVNAFSAAYKKEYQMDIDTFAAHGYDAGSIIVEAMKKAGTDSTKLRDQIEQTAGLAGVDGVYTYSPTNHDGLSVADLTMIKINNGAWVEAKQ